MMDRLGNGHRPARRTSPVSSLGLSRRRVLAGTLWAAGATALGNGLIRPGGGLTDLARLARAQEGTDLCEPVVRTSKNALLQVELVAGDDLSRGPGAVAYEGGGLVCPEGDGGFDGH